MRSAAAITLVRPSAGMLLAARLQSAEPQVIRLTCSQRPHKPTRLLPTVATRSASSGDQWLKAPQYSGCLWPSTNLRGRPRGWQAKVKAAGGGGGGRQGRSLAGAGIEFTCSPGRLPPMPAATDCLGRCSGHSAALPPNTGFPAASGLSRNNWGCV